jgi:CRP/FNR family transcriptional regulator, cyclic AMP receptor protein
VTADRRREAPPADISAPALALLQRSDVWAGLPAEALQEMAAIGREVRWRPGEFVFQIGDQSRDLFVLADGAVSLSLNPISSEASQAGAIDTPGEVFGWGALTPENYRIRNALCLRETRLFAIDGAELMRCLERHPAAGFQVLRRALSVILNHIMSLSAT